MTQDNDATGETPQITEEIINLEDMTLAEVHDIVISQWHPEKDGQGAPGQVHLRLRVKGMEDITLVLRLKSAQAVNDLIAALRLHRNEVLKDG